MLRAWRALYSVRLLTEPYSKKGQGEPGVHSDGVDNHENHGFIAENSEAPQLPQRSTVTHSMLITKKTDHLGSIEEALGMIGAKSLLNNRRLGATNVRTWG